MKKCLLFALPFVVLCACNKVGADIQESKTASITANCGNDTKTLLTQSGTGPYTYAMSWSDEDKIVVWDAIATVPSEQASTPLTGYQFVTATGGSNTAFFTCDSFKEGGFSSGNYIVLYPYYTGASTRAVSTVGNTTPNYYRVYSKIQINQTYDSTKDMGLSATTQIPMLGLIRVGESGYGPNELQFEAMASVIKLKLTNESGADVTIGQITLANDGAKERYGLAGETYYDVYPAGWTITRTHNLSATSPSNTITLDCGGVEIKDTESKFFSFVVPANRALGNLTWTVYAANKTSVIKSFTSTGSVGALTGGKVYTKTASL